MNMLPRLRRTGAASRNNAAPSAAARLIASVQAQVEPRWQAMAPRERTGLTLAAAAVALLLVWIIAVQPALDALGSLPPRQAEVDRQWQQMLTLASEARELRALPPLAPAQAEAALKSATDQLGA
jgi:general secretion pathway protein M